MSLFALALALVVAADPGPAPIQSSALDDLYDPASMTTVKGVIVAQHRRTRGARDLCLVLMTDGGTLDVHLGPFGFVDAQPVQLAAGDRVQVRGSLIRMEGMEMLIAQVVTRGPERLVLRDPGGAPRWPVVAKPRSSP